VNRPVVVALAIVLLLALTFSACSYVTWHERERLIRSADAGSTAAHVLILAANFWARHAVFLTILGIMGVFGIRRIFSRFW
jgi:hypothetical protein